MDYDNVWYWGGGGGGDTFTFFCSVNVISGLNMVW
jgi:hypothetical protein